jgi:predicted NAD/FAD-binding protein
MRIVVIGAGAAGVAAAWLLDRDHHVALYEAAPVPGGHIRTLGGNVAWDGPADLRLDAGVIELECKNFPTVFQILQRLGVPLREVVGATTLFGRDGARWWTPGAHAGQPAGARALEELKLWWLYPRYLRFVARARRGDLAGRTLDDLVSDEPFGRWLKLLTTYAWSHPVAEVGDVPAELAAPMLDRFIHSDAWYAVVGGTWAWVEAALADRRGPLHLGVRVTVRRGPDGVEVHHPDGTVARFDAVILAIPPHAAAAVLADPTPTERDALAACGSYEARVVVHDDDGPYRRRGHVVRTEFDCFDLGPGVGGYNACLRGLCGVPASDPRPYGLAYGLGDEIDPDRVLAEVTHVVPRFDRAFLAARDRLGPGDGRTLWAGAWRHDGLHEGALRSAVEAAERLGVRLNER